MPHEVERNQAALKSRLARQGSDGGIAKVISLNDPIAASISPAAFL
jgi:hypothetical protein